MEFNRIRNALEYFDKYGIEETQESLLKAIQSECHHNYELIQAFGSIKGNSIFQKCHTCGYERDVEIDSREIMSISCS